MHYYDSYLTYIHRMKYSLDLISIIESNYVNMLKDLNIFEYVERLNFRNNRRIEGSYINMYMNIYI
jgi:hypothetical protein